MLCALCNEQQRLNVDLQIVPARTGHNFLYFNTGSPRCCGHCRLQIKLARTCGSNGAVEEPVVCRDIQTLEEKRGEDQSGCARGHDGGMTDFRKINDGAAQGLLPPKSKVYDTDMLLPL